MVGKLIFKGWMAFYACVEGGAGLDLVNKGQIREVQIPIRVDAFNSQMLANMAWAFATVIDSDEALFAAVARKAEPRLHGFKSQELANTA